MTRMVVISKDACEGILMTMVLCYLLFIVQPALYKSWTWHFLQLYDVSICL